MDRFHQRGAPGFLFADAAALAHDAVLGETARHVHEHFARALADLLRRGQSEGDIRDDIHPQTAAWWLVSLLVGRSFRAAVVPDRARVEAELTEMARARCDRRSTDPTAACAPRPPRSIAT